MCIIQPQRIDFFGSTRIISVEQFQSLPEMNETTIEVFKNYMGCFNPAQKAISLKNQVKSLQCVESKLAQEPKKSTKDKCLSLILLAVKVSITATAIILGTVVNPALGFIGLAGVITSIIACAITGMRCPDADGFAIAMFPLCLHEFTFIYDAFTYKRDLVKGKECVEQYLKDSLQIVREVVSKKAVIEQGINQELAKINIMNFEANIDYNRVKQLHVALRELNKAEKFIKRCGVVHF